MKGLAPAHRPAPRLAGHGATAAFVVVVMLTILAYWPGVHGDFLFDDFANLPALGRYGGVRDAESLLWFLTSGIADPTGRPVSMASFLIDARDWPADPYPFKRTNILLHAANGLALFWTLGALVRRTAGEASRARWTAFVAATLWISHPLWASTVLYVVQRQAMLAMLFCLLGIRAWIAALDAFDADRRLAGWCLAFLAIPVAGSLAGLSKANGLLLPLLIASLHWTLLRDSRDGARRDRRDAFMLLVALPSLLVLGYVTYASIAAAPGVEAARGWTIGQRMLSQPRALAEYVQAIWMPGLDVRGIFADDFVVSRDLRTPATTFPALVTLAAAIVAMVFLRTRAPTVSAAVAFFLSAHLMESTSLPLELYFEHRNYLPAALMFLPLAGFITAQRRYRLYAIIGTGTLLVLLLGLTFAQARLWGDTGALSRAWAAAMPDSARAQNFAALVDLEAGRAGLAEARLVAASSRMPSEIQLAISLFKATCGPGRAPPSTARLEALLPRHGVSLDVSYSWLLDAMQPPSGDGCDLDSEAKERLLAAATARPPATAEEQARVSAIRAHDALHQGQCDRASTAFLARLQVQPRPEFALGDTGLLATVCGPEYGLTLLDAYLDAGAPVARAASPVLRLRDALMERSGYWTRELQGLRQTLSSEAASDTGGRSRAPAA